MKINDIFESTTSGSVATVAMPMGGTQKREGTLFKGKKTKKKFYESEVNEAEVNETDLILVPGQGKKLKPGFIPKDQDRRDHEVEMARSDLFHAAQNAKEVYKMIQQVSEDEGLEGWVQEKIIKANDYLNTVREYLEHKTYMQEGGVIAGGMSNFEEGWKGELAGGTIGGIAGHVAGSAVGGPIGGIIGGAVGGTGGGIIGRELTKEEQLNELAPILAAGARLVITMAPKIAQVLKNTGKATAKAAAPVAKSGAEIAAKNADKIGVGLGAYEIGSSAADIAKAITAKVGTALEEKTIMELAQVAFKFAIPTGIVLAILYGGKKVIDSLFSNSNQQQGVAEGWKEESQDLEDWSKEVNMRLYRAHETQRPGLARQLSKIEQKNFGSSLNQGSLTEIVKAALMALQKGQMVHYDPQRVGQMPFGNVVGDEAKLIAKYNITRDELAGYRMLHDKNMVDDLEQFLKLRRLVRAKSWPLEYFEELEKLTPEEAWLKMADDLNWSKDNMSEEVQAKTDDKLLAYYAQRKAEKQKKEQGAAEDQVDEEKDACYNKVKSRYKVWPSAYASGALVKCRKVGASNWGNSSKK